MMENKTTIFPVATFREKLKTFEPKYWYNVLPFANGNIVWCKPVLLFKLVRFHKSYLKAEPTFDALFGHAFESLKEIIFFVLIAQTNNQKEFSIRDISYRGVSVTKTVKKTLITKRNKNLKMMTNNK